MPVYKYIELIGTSRESWENAVKTVVRDCLLYTSDAADE